MEMSIVWLIIAIATGVFEAITVDLVSIWFCIGAIAALISYFLGAAIWLQIIIFLVASAGLVIATRPLSRKLLRGNIIRTNSDRLIGKHAVVTQPFDSEERGEVKVSGEIWSAITHDGSKVTVGDHVEILAIEGVKLIVRPIR